MRIIELKSENYKRIAAIDITPKEDLVLITGPNEQGKTSVLDALWSTLRSKAIPEKPIKDGEKKAENELTIGEEGVVKYIVKRTFTDKGNYLTVTNAEGARYPSPQKMLDEFVGDLCFDPLAFARMKSEEQIQLLMKLVKFEFDKKALESIGITQLITEPKVLNQLYTEIYNQRTLISKQMKQKDAELTAIPEVPKTEKVSTSALFTRLQSLQGIQKCNEVIHANHERTLLSMKEFKDKIKTLETQLYNFQKEEEQLHIDLLAQSQKIEKLKDPASAIHDVQEEIQNADSINTKAGLYEKRQELHQSMKEINSKWNTLNSKLLKINAVKECAIADAKMPIEHLKYDGDKITYKNIPLTQVSSAEKLKISLGIIIALNPKLRVIRIDDGSLLDTQNLQILKDIARQHNLQIWIEKVDDTGKVGFYIQEGEVKNTN